MNTALVIRSHYHCLCRNIWITKKYDPIYNGRTCIGLFILIFYEGMQEHQPDQDMHGNWKDGGSVESSQSV